MQENITRQITKHLKFKNQKAYLSESDILYCLFMISTAVRPKYTEIGKLFRELSSDFLDISPITKDLNGFVRKLSEFYNMSNPTMKLTMTEKEIMEHTVLIAADQLSTCEYVLTEILHRKKLSDRDVGKVFDEYLSINISPYLKHSPYKT